MSEMASLRVASLLASRLCHDLIGPLGAVDNGLELIAEAGRMAEEALALAQRSAKRAAARLRYFRYAFRTLLRSPVFSIAAVLVLALGIGANSAIFTVIRAVLLAPLPYPDPDRLVNLYESQVLGEGQFNSVSAPNFFDWQRDARSFEQMAFWGESTPVSNT